MKKYTNDIPARVYDACKYYILAVEKRGGKYEPLYMPPEHEKYVKRLRKLTKIFNKLREEQSTGSSLHLVAALFDIMDDMPYSKMAPQKWGSRFQDDSNLKEFPELSARRLNLGECETSKDTEKRNCLDLPEFFLFEDISKWIKESVLPQLNLAMMYTMFLVIEIQKKWSQYHEVNPVFWGASVPLKSPTHIKRRRDPRLLELATVIIRDGSKANIEAIIRIIKNEAPHPELFDSINSSTLKDAIQYLNDLGVPPQPNVIVNKALAVRED